MVWIFLVWNILLVKNSLWINYVAFNGIHFMNLNHKQDLIEKYFHQRNHTDHIYHDYLAKIILKLLFEILNFIREMFCLMEPYPVYRILWRKLCYFFTECSIQKSMSNSELVLQTLHRICNRHWVLLVLLLQFFLSYFESWFSWFGNSNWWISGFNW